jgi:hypothetical protein
LLGVTFTKWDGAASAAGAMIAAPAKAAMSFFM